MSNSGLGWLAVAFAITWLCIGVYVVRLWRAQREIAAKLDRIESNDGR